MKAFTHKKTDKIDSEVIAQLALNKMIQASRVFPKDHRERKVFQNRKWFSPFLLQLIYLFQ